MRKAPNSLTNYESYKDSGISWLGIIPFHWSIRRLKFLFTEINERSNNGLEELLSVSQYSGVTKRSEKISEGGLVSNAESLEGYKKVQEGDLVSNIMLAWNGSLAFSPYSGIVSPAYSVYRLSSNYDNVFYNYLLRTESYKAEYKKRSKGVIDSRLRLYTHDFYSLWALTPPLVEQKKIASFLDLKTRQIDQAISIKERQIGLLKERKRLLVQHTVTYGLASDVPMRESGIEWIGEVPAHWEIKKARYLGSTQNGISAGAEFFGHGYPFISYGDVYNNEQLPESVSGLANASVTEMSQYSVERGDVLFTRTSETIEEIGFASTCFNVIANVTFAGFLIRFRPKKNKLFEGYSKYYFNAPMLRSYFVKEMSIVTRASLSQQLLKNMPVLLPPIEEQKEIYVFLERESAKFKRSVEIQIQQIKTLKEYKTTLINSAVTGKIKVPGVLELAELKEREIAL